VDENQINGCEYEKMNDLKAILKKINYAMDLRVLQCKVCMEVLKGRHSSFKGTKRNDIFVSAPCGFGKSLCFILSAYALGGITVRICIIAQQMVIFFVGAHNFFDICISIFSWLLSHFEL
jgi:hypothetical protein